jgi:hypothetical protein
MGGAIFNYIGTLNITNSTLSGNFAKGGACVGVGGGGGSGLGAAVFNYNGSVKLLNSTLAANSVTGGAGGDGRPASQFSPAIPAGPAGDATGAALFVISDGTGNTATVTTNNTILADSNTGADFVATTNGGGTAPSITGGNNLVESSSGVPGGVISVTADPKLGPLQDNGGPTLTHALLAGSPAINAGDNALIPPDTLDLDGDGKTAEPVPFDQRGAGFARIVGGTVDIGAFEAPPPNRAPTVTDFTKVGAEDNTLAFTAADFTGHYSDPDGDALAKVRIESLPSGGTLKLGTAAVTAGQVIAAADLSLLTFVPNLNFSGTVTFQYTASDGVAFAATAATITLDIRSAAQQAAALQAQVAALRDAGVLNGGQANALTVKLNLKGNAGDIGKVQSFLDQVRDFLRAGLLTQDQADSLLGPGNTLLLSVTRR